MATKFTNINTGAVTTIPLDLELQIVNPYPLHPTASMFTFFEIYLPQIIQNNTWEYVYSRSIRLNNGYKIEFDIKPRFMPENTIYGELIEVLCGNNVPTDRITDFEPLSISVNEVRLRWIVLKPFGKNKLK